MRLATFCAVAALAAVGCGSASSAPSDATTTATPATSLTISFWAGGDGTSTPRKWTLRCGPIGGSHPRARFACDKLAAIKAPFAAPGNDLACTQIFGGPERALVRGTYRRTPVRVELSLRDGCEIARFKQLEFLVPGFKASSGVGSSA